MILKPSWWCFAKKGRRPAHNTNRLEMSFQIGLYWLFAHRNFWSEERIWGWVGGGVCVTAAFQSCLSFFMPSVHIGFLLLFSAGCHYKKYGLHFEAVWVLYWHTPNHVMIRWDQHFLLSFWMDNISILRIVPSQAITWVSWSENRPW